MSKETLTEDDLLPCPFCGEEAEMDSQQSFMDFQGRLRKRIAIYCTSCPAEVGMCYDDCEGLSREMVIPLWNRRAVRVEVREVEQNAAQEGSQAETDESRRDGAHRSPVASKRPDADVSKGSNPECLIGAENCPPAAAPTHDALTLEQALQLAIRQNSHDMLMTGEEIRRCETALAESRAECEALKHDIERHIKIAAEHLAECERLREQVYVPGVWKCAKCKMELVASILAVSSSSIHADNRPQECPNNCGPMWRITERDQRKEAQALHEKEFMRAQAAETREREAYERAAQLEGSIKTLESECNQLNDMVIQNYAVIDNLASMCRRLSYSVKRSGNDRLAHECVELLKKHDLGGSVIRTDALAGERREG